MAELQSRLHVCVLDVAARVAYRPFIFRSMGKMPVLEIAPARTRPAWDEVRAHLTRLGTSVAVRERALASATFACIFALGAFCLDQIVTGGVDWNPGDGQAYALAPAVSASVPEAQEPALAPARSVLPVLNAASEIDFRYTAEELLGGPEHYLGEAALDVSWVVASNNAETPPTPKKSALSNGARS